MSAAVLVAATSCGSPEANPGTAATPGAAGAVSAATPAAAAAAATPSRAPDPTAPPTDDTIGRPAAAGKKKYTVPEKKAGEGATYPDGVTVSLTGLTRGTSTGAGPGALPGMPMVTFQLKVHNASTAAVDLSKPVIGVRYTSPGSKPQYVAQGHYEDGSKDLAGLLAPGADALATYSFLVPEKSHLRIAVDLDADHAPAIFIAN